MIGSFYIVLFDLAIQEIRDDWSFEQMELKFHIYVQIF